MQDVNNFLQMRGISEDLYKKLWLSYIALIDGGRLLAEKSWKEAPLTVGCGINFLEVTMDNPPRWNGNIANIIINGYNCSLNRRGLNFVAMKKIMGR